MPPIPWYEKTEYIEKLHRYIIKNGIIDFSTVQLENICDNLDLDKQKCIKGVFVHKRKLWSLSVAAKNYLKDNNISITSLNIANHIRWKQTKYGSKLDLQTVKLSYIHTSKNIYRTTKLFFEDQAEICHCSSEEKCGFNSACENRLVMCNQNF